MLELRSGVGHIGLGAVRDSQRHLVMVDLISAHAERLPTGSVTVVQTRAYQGGVIVRLAR